VPKQLRLSFDDVPLTCQAQRRYHAIAPVLAGRRTAPEQARTLDLSYATVHRWLRRFRDEGMPGLFTAAEYPREPQTEERLIVLLVYYKCCVPSATDRELARVLSAEAGRRLHHETVKALLSRYPFWRYAEFRDLIHYPTPADTQARRAEMLKLHEQGWMEKRIAQLLRCSRNTVMKWLRRAAVSPDGRQDWLLDPPRAPRRTTRKVYFGSIHATLELQRKYGYAGWFRIRSYLERDYGIRLGEGTLKRLMRLNRRVHLAPQRPARDEGIRDPREGPPVSRHPFEHCFIDIRHLDARPGGVQLYSTLLLEGFSRTILAGSLTPVQDVGVVLYVYYLALLEWGRWAEVMSDHGGQFRSLDFQRVNRRLAIRHEMYEKGHPWRNLIEAQFGIQARVGEYAWERCGGVEAAEEIHRDLIRDHNRLPHFAHRKREDDKKSSMEVLGGARGQGVEPAALHQAFSRKFWRRKTDSRGFVRVGRWRIYVEEGLPRTPVEVIYWDGRLRAEYRSEVLTEYDCRWDASRSRPRTVGQEHRREHPFGPRQQKLFDPLWVRDPVEEVADGPRPQKKVAAGGGQMRLYLGPELVKPRR
jgi:transposase